jgi:hypothetical protein
MEEEKIEGVETPVEEVKEEVVEGIQEAVA